jgi:hypothetical protein
MKTLFSKVRFILFLLYTSGSLPAPTRWMPLVERRFRNRFPAQPIRRDTPEAVMGANPAPGKKFRDMS